jgi:hypothetical protein
MEEVSKHEENKKNFVRKNFENQLRIHGFGFQYAVIEEIIRLYNAEQCAFAPKFAEFPVEINNTNTHIDFILERVDRSQFPIGNPFYLICECKRANPAVSNWCFVQAPFYRDGLYFDQIYLESLEINKDWDTKKTFIHQASPQAKKVFDIAFNVKSDKEGEGDTKGASDAVTQVLRGMNGFIEYLGKKENLIRIEHKESFIPRFFPVIFTTGELWSSTVELKQADLNNGNLDLPIESLVNESWILFQYNQSQPIRHSINVEHSTNKIFDVAQAEFTRTVAIVNPKGISSFLYWISHFSKFV